MTVSLAGDHTSKAFARKAKKAVEGDRVTTEHAGDAIEGESPCRTPTDRPPADAC
jgi:hypothetical protein